MGAAGAFAIALEVLKFATEARKIFGDNITNEQIADMFEKQAVRFAEGSDAWRMAAAAEKAKRAGN